MLQAWIVQSVLSVLSLLSTDYRSRIYKHARRSPTIGIEGTFGRVHSRRRGLKGVVRRRVRVLLAGTHSRVISCVSRSLWMLTARSTIPPIIHGTIDIALSGYALEVLTSLTPLLGQLNLSVILAALKILSLTLRGLFALLGLDSLLVRQQLYTIVIDSLP